MSNRPTLIQGALTPKDAAWYSETITTALCNSCLRVRHFDGYQAAHESNCDCGATFSQASAFCACPSCSLAAELLLDGERDLIKLGLSQSVDLSNWSAECGLECKA